MNKTKLVITGATGFVGERLTETLIKQGFPVQIVTRKKLSQQLTPTILVSSIDKSTHWADALHAVDCVVHCAARVHVMNENSASPLEAFREVNTYGTLNLAQQAADAGVKRFIFISTIKVNGESTELESPFKPDDNYVPTDPYSLSKYEAEVGLLNIAKETCMEVVIIRPPLVYGEGVKANFASMMKWMDKDFPLPLGAIKQNKRSLVSVDNLVDLIVTCIGHPNAANQTFLVSDDNDVSTTELLENMAIALNKPSRLLPVPASWFNFIVDLINKPVISQRLCGSLHVDISKTKELLNWVPPYSSVECMKKTANAFLDDLNKKKKL